jgi:hypothetical protein
MKVLNIFYSDFAFFKSLNILPILKALRIVAYGPTEMFVVCVKIIATKVPITIMKSKRFHPSLK